GVRLNNGLENREAEPGNNRFGGNTRLKDPRQKLGGDPRAIVAHYNLVATSHDPNVPGAGLSGVQEEIHQHSFPLSGIALQAKVGIDLVHELDLRHVGAFQVVQTKLGRVRDHGSELGGGTIGFEDAIDDSSAAIDAALQSVSQPFPLRVGLQQVRALSDGLENVVQIVD